jgi:hypothetical protein
MSDMMVAMVARRLAEALARSAYERTDEAKKDVSQRLTELVRVVREEVAHD